MRPHLAIPRIFDRPLWRHRRHRQAAQFGDHDFLHRRAMIDIIDRLETIKRGFDRALFYGTGNLEALLTPACAVGMVVGGDSVASRLKNCLAPDRDAPQMVFDEEHLPLAPASVDLVVSLLTLHTVNDIVGALVQYRQALKPDGLFLAALFGATTLTQLRNALITAELEITGGAAIRVHPFADIKGLGGALSRAGFALPVVDVDVVKVTYRVPADLFRDLRALGETCILADRPPPLKRAVMMRAMEILGARDARSEINFEIAYLTAFAPHPGQPKPLKPGSARASLERHLAKD